MSLVFKRASTHNETASSFSNHLAAISPYLNINKQPATPASRKVLGAVYLFRHGIIEVSNHDYRAFIAPFLQRLYRLQQVHSSFAKGPLSFLNSYRSWITEAHVGAVNEQGLRQCRELGAAFRQRYKQWLSLPQSRLHDMPVSQGTAYQRQRMAIWSDKAARCRFSATEFADAFGGVALSSADGLQKVDTSVIIIDPKTEHDPCKNLSWHTSYPSIDQAAGGKQMGELMDVTTSTALARFEPFWFSLPPSANNASESVDSSLALGPRDVYAMQLLHCYDVVSGRPSPWTDPEPLFTSEDWAGFEYLRDVKYYYSEGYGAQPSTGVYATPWLVSAVERLKKGNMEFDTSPDQEKKMEQADQYGQNIAERAHVDNKGEEESCAGHDDIPLHIAFTHREEILYLCVLLRLNLYANHGTLKTPSTRPSTLASRPRDPPDITNATKNATQWTPSLSSVQTEQDRPWRVAQMAPYLGHVGLETYVAASRGGGSELNSEHQQKMRIRVIVNGEVVKVFEDEVAESPGSPTLVQDDDGGYELDAFEKVIGRKKEEWERRYGQGAAKPCRWVGER